MYSGDLSKSPPKFYKQYTCTLGCNVPQERFVDSKLACTCTCLYPSPKLVK